MKKIDFQKLTDVINEKSQTTAPAIQLVVRQDGECIYQGVSGWVDPETRQRPVNSDTLFDLASVTKLFTTTCFMTLVEEGKVALDQAVSSVMPEFSGIRAIAPYEDPLHWGEWLDVTNGEKNQVDAGTITFRQLLCHSSGLPAWRPFKDQGNIRAAKKMLLETTFAYKPESRLLYSDLGLILVGMAIERLTNSRLDTTMQERVFRPLGLTHTLYLPQDEKNEGVNYENIAPTEMCRWRNRRVVGEVHDENAWRFGGIAGHAGLFSTAEEVANLGQAYLDRGKPLLKPATVAEMLTLQRQYGDLRRGIGFLLWSADPEASSHPFSQETFGHTGFTGTSLWVDRQRSLVVALMTNEVYFGREDRKTIPLRLDIHNTLLSIVDAKNK